MNAPTIESVVVSEKDATKVDIVVAGKRAGTLRASVARTLGVQVGTLWTEALAGHVKREGEIERARVGVVKQIGKRALTRVQVADRLAAKGLTADEVARVVSELESLGVVDDAAYARAMVEGKLARSPIGKRALSEQLSRRGIDAGVVAEEVESVTNGRDEGEDAYQVAVKKLRTMAPELEGATVMRRVVGFLARRGFDEEVCVDACRRAMRASGRRFDEDDGGMG